MKILPAWYHTMPFRRQLLIAVMLGVLSTVLLSALGSSWQGSRQIRLTLVDQGQRVAENLARQSRLALLFDSTENAATAVDNALSFPDVILVEIWRANGRLLVARQKPGTAPVTPALGTQPQRDSAILEKETDHTWQFVVSVLATDQDDSPFDAAPRRSEVLGFVRVVQSKETLEQLVRNVIVVNLAIALLFTLLFLVTIRALSERLGRPLTELSDAMARAERGETNVRARDVGPRDIAEMAHAFNSMMIVLEEREQELRRARDEALRFAKLKAQFATTVSHEIRTPLNGVIGTLDMLMATSLPDRQKQFVEIAWDSSRYLLELINDILDFSKLEASKLELENVALDLRRVVEEAIELLAQQAHLKGIELGYVVASEVPELIMGDAARIRQVLINLIGNAVKFTDSGEVAVRVTVPDAAPARLRIEVSDTGIGIPEQAQAQIFDSFTQADTTSTRRHGGSGLGLAICKQLVVLMGGEIGVESERGGGSRFWFSVPLTAAESQPARGAGIPRGDGRRVLIVEDSTIVSHFLQHSLESWGYVCETARNTDEASAHLLEARTRGAPFDVAILDTGFATFAGGELPERIRRDPTLSATRLILMNRLGVADPPAASRADAHLTKPLRLERLLESIATVTGRHKQPAAVPAALAAAAKAHRVLVVEDNRTNQTVACAMLGMLGCQSEVAADGQLAVQMFMQQPWDMVLMDCSMPGMDGYEVTEMIRRYEAEHGAARTPIIAMTANTQSADIEKCLASGMDDHLPKPLTLGSLTAKVHRWMPEHAVDLRTGAADVARAAGERESAEPLDRVLFDKLRETLGEVIGQMIQPFLEDMPEYIAQMRSALAASESDRLHRAAHAIKGAASNLGASNLSHLAKVIEDSADDTAHATLEAAISRLDSEFERVRQALLVELKAEPAAAQADVNEGALILVVDDDRSTRSALRYALQRSGFRVEEAIDGAQALALLDRIRPDAILMDALMANMDGFTACAKLQEMPHAKDIPVLMITALEDSQSIERAFAAGASDYISKPIHLAVVNQRVKRIIEATRAARHVRHLAYNDVLTGLPNRALFGDFLNQAIARAEVRAEALAVLFLDLDRFKFVNDTLGHEIGDRLLKSVARRIQQCVRADDCVARLGGDEFTVVLEDLPSVAAASNAAQKICRALSTAFEVDGHDIFVSASIGISLYPGDGTDASTLLRHADTAMYRAKNDNAGFQFYEAGMEIAASEHLRMENALRHALERNEFIVHYQPYAETASGKIIGAEALVRWRHPTRGLVAPSEFIPLAEETGMIVQLGEWVLRTACRQASRWHATGAAGFSMSVNLSGTQLRQARFAEMVESILRETALAPQMLTLEITESVLMEHAPETLATLERLKEIGVTLAIDDFGTGYSSLAYLKRFPVSVLKVDRTFTRDVTTDPDDAAIVTGMIALAHSLRLKVVAEGVETQAQHDFLSHLNCDFIQGYYLSEPVPADSFEQNVLAAHFPDNVFAFRPKRS
jgi:diguanylate cyclase (GGDEF)-like protein